MPKKDLTDEERAQLRKERIKAEAVREFKKHPGVVRCKICESPIYLAEILDGRSGYAYGKLGKSFICSECYKRG